jgi:hypothetical protein
MWRKNKIQFEWSVGCQRNKVEIKNS